MSGKRDTAAVRAGQSGNVVAAVTAIGTAGMLALSALMNSSVTLEEKAIDAHLAEVRAYWAATGHFNYALSRTALNEACAQIVLPCFGQGTDTAKAAGVQTYLNELSLLGYSTMTYPEETASAYFINLTVTAAADDTPGKGARSGHLMMRSGFGATQGSAPALANLATRLPKYELRFCVGLNDEDENCKNINSNGGGSYTEYFRVKRLMRLPN